MVKRTSVATNRSKYSIVKVENIDNNGNVSGVYFEVQGPNGNVLETFSSLSEAEALLQSLDQDHEPPSPGMGM